MIVMKVGHTLLEGRKNGHHRILRLRASGPPDSHTSTAEVTVRRTKSVMKKMTTTTWVQVLQASCNGPTCGRTAESQDPRQIENPKAGEIRYTGFVQKTYWYSRYVTTVSYSCLFSNVCCVLTIEHLLYSTFSSVCFSPDSNQVASGGV